MQDPGNAAPLGSSGSAAQPDAATDYIAVEAEASMSMDAIVTELTAHSTDDARDVIKAAQTILKGDRDAIRNLCKPWGVQLRCQKRYRLSDTIKQEPKMSLAKRAMELKSATDASAGGAATEHAESEFHVDDALAETLRSLQAIDTSAPIFSRVIDHACSSEHCISQRVVTLLRRAHWKTSADLYNDQPLDACGYIAADVVCRLRDAALSVANSWHHIQLPDYAQLECISRGNKLLRKKSEDRIFQRLRLMPPTP